jgi:hypothetical protein
MGWLEFHHDFTALMNEEDRLFPNHPKDCLSAIVTYEHHDEYGRWALRPSTESLRARFDLKATEAGIALGLPGIASPMDFWLHRLYRFLREGKSSFLSGADDDFGIIMRLCEASSIYCAYLQREWLEKTNLGHEGFLRTRIEDTLSKQQRIDLLARGGELITEGEHRIDTPYPSSIAAQLQELRTESRWTFDELAAKVGLDIRTVQRHVAGTSVPYSRHLTAYEAAFSKHLKKQVVIRKLP